MRRGLSTERYFRTIHPEYPWIAAWRAPRRDYCAARDKSELHQSSSHLLRQIQPVQNGFFPFMQIRQMQRDSPDLGHLLTFPLLETELHLQFSIRPQKLPCQGRLI